jgi:hypothetical protein
MRWAGTPHARGDKQCLQNFSLKTSKKEATWETQAYIGLIISKLITKQDVVAWSGFVWLRARVYRYITNCIDI